MGELAHPEQLFPIRQPFRKRWILWLLQVGRAKTYGRTGHVEVRRKIQAALFVRHVTLESKHVQAVSLYLVNDARHVEFPFRDVQLSVEEHASPCRRIIPDVFFVPFPCVAPQEVAGDTSVRHFRNLYGEGFQQGVYKLISDRNGGTHPPVPVYRMEFQIIGFPLVPFLVFFLVGDQRRLGHHDFLYVPCQFVHIGCF